MPSEISTFEPGACFMISAGRGARLSIVIPLFDEVESASWVLTEVRDLFPDAEIVAVDDGSTDGTWTTLRELSGIRRYRLRANRGQSAALWVGLKAATRDFCVIMDGDGQNDPVGIVELVAALQDADIACGVRDRRRDSWSKRVASRIANALRRAVLRDGARDAGCSLKAFPREHVEALIPFDGMHRFLPALFRAAGLSIVEVEVQHRPRRFGRSKYGNIGRAFRGIYDLMGMRWFVGRRIRLPHVEVSDE